MAALASVLLGAGLATAGTPAQAAPLDADCNLATYVDAIWMECSITESASVTFVDLVPEHLTPHDGTDVIMTARGGSGAFEPVHLQQRLPWWRRWRRPHPGRCRGHR